jgi:hypothetical protein
LLPKKRRDDDDVIAGYVWRDRAFRAYETHATYDARRFASKVLRALSLHEHSVAIFHGTRGVHIESGRDWSRGGAYRWATVSVAPWATREEVVTSLLALAGRASEPLLVATLLALDELD